MENSYFLSKKELSFFIKDKFDALEINRIISAYDMADVSFDDKKNICGQPYFFHNTRVCKILITELDVSDSDLLIVSLLHHIYDTCSDINDEILLYNFSPYVVYLINALKQDILRIQDKLKNIEIIRDKKFVEDDYLIIKLAEHLDNLRFASFNTDFNPLNYIMKISSILLSISQVNKNKNVQYLLNELNKEKIKILS